MERALHRQPAMRVAVGLGFAFAACGCAEVGGAIPRTSAEEAMPSRTAIVDDPFDEAFAEAQHITPPAEHAPSRSLGHLGDQPIGELTTPPHHDPAWTRPFPCHWTGTCGLVPIAPYAVPYLEVHSGED